MRSLLDKTPNRFVAQKHSTYSFCSTVASRDDCMSILWKFGPKHVKRREEAEFTRGEEDDVRVRQLDPGPDAKSGRPRLCIDIK